MKIKRLNESNEEGYVINGIFFIAGFSESRFVKLSDDDLDTAYNKSGRYIDDPNKCIEMIKNDESVREV